MAAIAHEIIAQDIASSACFRGTSWSRCSLTAIVAVPASIFSAVAVKDLTLGSCELVAGSKSSGPCSPAERTSDLAHSRISDFEKYFGFSFSMKAPPRSPLPDTTRV